MAVRTCSLRPPSSQNAQILKWKAGSVLSLPLEYGCGSRAHELWQVHQVNTTRVIPLRFQKAGVSSWQAMCDRAIEWLAGRLLEIFLVPQFLGE